MAFQPALRARTWTTRLLATPAPWKTDPRVAAPTADTTTGATAHTRGAGAPPTGPDARWVPTVVSALMVTAAYLGRDLLFLLAAHAPQPGQSRRVALARGRAAMSLLRQVRAETIARALGPSGTAGRARVRLITMAVLVGLLVGIFWIGPTVAHQIGATPRAHALGARPGVSNAYFAGFLDALGVWWSALPSVTKIVIGAGIAALVILSGGSLAGALGVSGAATYLLGHASGAATFAKDPAAAGSYLTHTTPLGVAADTAEAVLTLLPSNLAGAAIGKLIRDGIDLYRVDPAAFRAGLGAAKDDLGAVRFGSLTRSGRAQERLWRCPLARGTDPDASHRRWTHRHTIARLPPPGRPHARRVPLQPRRTRCHRLRPFPPACSPIWRVSLRRTTWP